ncbi:TPA: general secretion pathway protein GspE, partial [Candidatus Sumerlaeota bacterium]|nr:general secretion pathway protein GspE [Candidatus Sumerlaeota bacterium]
MNELLQQMIDAKQITQGDADALAKECNGSTPTLDESQILQWLGTEYGVPFSELEEIEPDPKLLSLFPARVLLKQGVLPVRRLGDRVEIATSRLFATEGIDLLKSMTGLKLVPLLAPTEAITRKMKKHLGVGADTLDTLEEEAGIQVVSESNDENVDLDEAAKDASIIKFVNQVLGDAIALRATDVHIEPFEEELRIRYRIDGVLQEVPTPTSVKRFQAAIVSRVKILSHLDIAEKRLPQDGRIKVRVENHEVDIRVSLIPMLHGEAVVLRLLQQDTELRGLKHLQMDPRDQAIFAGLLNIPHGIILVTGPT